MQKSGSSSKAAASSGSKKKAAPKTRGKASVSPAAGQTASGAETKSASSSSSKKPAAQGAPKKASQKPPAADASAQPTFRPAKERYQSKTPREQVLLRPSMYVGAVTPERVQEYVWDPVARRMVLRWVRYTAGLLKLIEEAAWNTADHSQRDPTMRAIRITVVDRRRVCVANDGVGVSVEYLEKQRMYVPQMVFGELMSGENYDDSKTQLVGGQNGLGVKLANFLSLAFQVETTGADDSGTLYDYSQQWRRNGREVDPPVRTRVDPLAKKRARGHMTTRVTFEPDFAKFGYATPEFDDDMVRMIERVAWDLAGTLAERKIAVSFGTNFDYSSTRAATATATATEKVAAPTPSWGIGSSSTSSSSTDGDERATLKNTNSRGSGGDAAADDEGSDDVVKDDKDGKSEIWSSAPWPPSPSPPRPPPPPPSHSSLSLISSVSAPPPPPPPSSSASTVVAAASSSSSSAPRSTTTTTAAAAAAADAARKVAVKLTSKAAAAATTAAAQPLAVALLKVRDFKAYVAQFLEPGAVCYASTSERWSVVVAGNGGVGVFQHLAFCNSILAKLGGTHLTDVTGTLVRVLLAGAARRGRGRDKVERADLKPDDVRRHLFVAVTCLVDKPRFDSQSKTKLTTPKRKFGSAWRPSAEFVARLERSDLVERALAAYHLRQERAQKRADTKRNAAAAHAGGALTGIDKLVDARDAGRPNAAQYCTLVLTEGDSARALALSGMRVVKRARFGAMALKGKVFNVRDAPEKRLRANLEIQNIMRVLGLSWGQRFAAPEEYGYHFAKDANRTRSEPVDSDQESEERDDDEDGDGGGGGGGGEQTGEEKREREEKIEAAAAAGASEGKRAKRSSAKKKGAIADAPLPPAPPPLPTPPQKKRKRTSAKGGGGGDGDGDGDGDGGGGDSGTAAAATADAAADAGKPATKKRTPRKKPRKAKRRKLLKWPLRYGRVMIMADQDNDGSHIKGLLFNLFASEWPELFEMRGFLTVFKTPIVKITCRVADKSAGGGGGGGAGKKGRGRGGQKPERQQRPEQKSFFTLPEFDLWKAANPGYERDWAVKYYKGLGTSTPKEAIEYFRHLERHITLATLESSTVIAARLRRRRQRERARDSERPSAFSSSSSSSAFSISAPLPPPSSTKSPSSPSSLPMLLPPLLSAPAPPSLTSLLLAPPPPPPPIPSSLLAADGSANGDRHDRDEDERREKAAIAAAASESHRLMRMAFGKRKTEVAERRRWVAAYRPGTYLDQRTYDVTYADFVDRELLLYSVASVRRAVPSVVDGLKPGQRKILYAAFKRRLHSECKVSQLAGYVSEHAAYHHAEASLAATVVGLAQNHVDSNNINFLYPGGSFGTRLGAGADAASARYISTRLEPVARAVFDARDDAVLLHLDDDGQLVEPEHYFPVVPPLYNGFAGIATSVRTSCPPVCPRVLVRNMRARLRDEPLEPMPPFVFGFKGTFVPRDPNAAKYDALCRRQAELAERRALRRVAAEQRAKERAEKKATERDEKTRERAAKRAERQGEASAAAAEKKRKKAEKAADVSDASSSPSSASSESAPDGIVVAATATATATPTESPLQKARREEREAKRSLAAALKAARAVEAERVRQRRAKIVADERRRRAAVALERAKNGDPELGGAAAAAATQKDDPPPTPTRRRAAAAAAVNDDDMARPSLRRKPGKKVVPKAKKCEEEKGGDEKEEDVEDAPPDETERDRATRAHIIDYESRGVYDVRRNAGDAAGDGGCVIRVTELPVASSDAIRMDRYDDFCNALVAAGRALRYEPLSVGDEVDARLHCTAAQLEAFEKAPGGVARQLSLVASISMRNIHMFAPDGKLRRYDSLYEVVDDYYPVRYAAYERRHAAMERQQQAEIARVDYRIRFLTEVMADTLHVRRVKRREIVRQLVAKGYPRLPPVTRAPKLAKRLADGATAPVVVVVVDDESIDTVDGDEDGDDIKGDGDDAKQDASATVRNSTARKRRKTRATRDDADDDGDDDSDGDDEDKGLQRERDNKKSYRYLTSLPIDAQSEEKIARLEADKAQRVEELARFKLLTVRDMWEADLAAFEAALDEHDAARLDYMSAMAELAAEKVEGSVATAVAATTRASSSSSGGRAKISAAAVRGKRPSTRGRGRDATPSARPTRGTKRKKSISSVD